MGVLIGLFVIVVAVVSDLLQAIKIEKINKILMVLNLNLDWKT